jgi:CHAT domain-containing protein
VGSTTALGNITANSQGTTSLNSVNAQSLTTDASGTTQLNGNVTTTNSQTYNNITNLAGSNLTSNSGNVDFTNAVNQSKTNSITAYGSIDFNKTLDGSQNLSLTAGGNINFNGTVGSLTPQIGLTINNAANITGNDVNVASLNEVSNSGNTTLGNVTAGSGAVNLTSSNNITTGSITTNGQDINLNSKNIVTGNITSVSTNGSNGGNITMVSNNQNIGTINAQGGKSGIGGTIDLTVDDSFQATGTFTDQNGTLTSISTSGGAGSGAITIRYGIAPFVVGDSTFVGTTGAIASSAGNIISPPQTYYSTYTQGNISLIYRDAIQTPSQLVTTPSQPATTTIEPVITLPEQATTTPEPVTTLPEQVLFPDNPESLPNSIIPNIQQSALNEPDFIRQTLSYNFSNGHTQEIIDDPNIFLIEQLRDSEFTGYYGRTLAPLAEIQTAEDIRKTLKKIFEQTGKRSAVIYTVSQPESMEIIVVFPEGKVIYRNVKIKREVLLSLTKDFRNRVVDPFKIGYKASGEKIYNLLIAPIQADLVAQKIDTLLFSVDGGLRSIPMAALYDGHHFLVENYSLGLIPSISLMDTNFKPVNNSQVLAMGASKFLEQISLPGVVVELPVVAHEFGEKRFFINKEFTVKNLQVQRQKFPAQIIHLATHGEFNSGTPSNSFIQFWNKEKLRLDQVRELHLQDPPVELLVLSSCRTALGSEDVELGFAGLAIQSGAKSALASLWSVSDEGTLALMSEFYQDLKTSSIKAEAVQRAQIAMIQGKLYVKNGRLYGTKTSILLPPDLKVLNNQNLFHPYYWAAFTMIGSPW